MRHIGRLAKVTHRATRLIRSAAYSVAFWGHEIKGMPPSTIVRLASSVAFATGITHPGRCATTAIALGVGRHPLIEAVDRVLVAWFKFAARGFPRNLRLVWMRLYNRICVM